MYNAVTELHSRYEARNIGTGGTPISTGESFLDPGTDIESVSLKHIPTE